MNMNGKVAIITGAARGIGLACAEAFARSGAITILSDINKPDEQAQKLAGLGFPAEAMQCDVSSTSSVKELITKVSEKHGHIDAAVNNAGIQTPQTPMAEELIRRNPQIESELIRDIPAGRLGSPEEIADAVLWLCSPQASFMAGHALLVDGGFTIH